MNSPPADTLPDGRPGTPCDPQPNGDLGSNVTTFERATAGTTEGRSAIEALAALVRDRRAVALTGAGISTESGIPDYRGPSSSRRPRTPMQFREFAGSDRARARYWARSAIGWPQMAARTPNAGHYALARLESAGFVQGVITQNVDRLHQRAGSNRVIELHGALDEVVCMQCRATEDRAGFQQRLLGANPGWDRWSAAMAPDGDVDLPETASASFHLPGCSVCGGAMKPNVVFFGENVPASRVTSAWELLAQSDLLLVLGSSLTVFSGYRFVDRSVRDGRPVAIVNSGPTRGDASATLRIDARLGDVLPALYGLLVQQ